MKKLLSATDFEKITYSKCKWNRTRMRRKKRISTAKIHEYPFRVIRVQKQVFAPASMPEDFFIKNSINTYVKIA